MVFFQILQLVQHKCTWCFYWFGLGVLSSIGLGTGLHTFLLYLGPHIASVTLAAYECGGLNFPEPPYPDELVSFTLYSLHLYCLPRTLQHFLSPLYVNFSVQYWTNSKVYPCIVNCGHVLMSKHCQGSLWICWLPNLWALSSVIFPLLTRMSLRISNRARWIGCIVK